MLDLYHTTHDSQGFDYITLLILRVGFCIHFVLLDNALIAGHASSLEMYQAHQLRVLELLAVKYVKQETT